MALARMVAPSNVRRLVVVLGIVSALAFVLGQGVAAYQGNLVRQPAAALQRMANQVGTQVTEQIAIARGVTPTPTVRVIGHRPVTHNAAARGPVTMTAALIASQQSASDTQQPSDAQQGRHADSKGDAHHHDKQKGDQQGKQQGDHHHDQQQAQGGANGQSSDHAGGNQGSDAASHQQGSDQQKPDKHHDSGDQTTTDTSSQQ